MNHRLRGLPAPFPRRLPKRRALLGAIAVLVTAGLLQFANVNPAVSQSVAVTAYQAGSDPGMDPGSSIWKEAIPVRLPLSAQAGAYSAGGGGVDLVTVRALHYNGQLYLRTEWADKTKDDSTARAEDFSDAVAVEFPASGSATIPSICMGQADAAVNIWQWRADSQAGGFNDLTQRYVQAQIDGVLSKDDLWFPARFLKNPVANPDQGPVQTLVARAFGTLSPAGTQDVQGNGRYANGTWAVVFKRPFAGADADQATFSSGKTMDAAFAVWNGSDGDRNGRKSVSQLARITVVGMASPDATHSDSLPILFAVVLLGGFSALGLGIAAYGASHRGAGA